MTAGDGGQVAGAAEVQGAEPIAERRLVSVLFADLVGFTRLSETRDPEEVRGLLSRYFDNCRRLVELYGGIVEKFIGDAVMAVWGAPTAQEDDAERAVRAALDLVAAVTALGDEIGAVGLRARGGVSTGEASVDLVAVAEGMVAGDLVNTAARIQAEAEPGTVLVGEGTWRASNRAIAYEDAGERMLKGKAKPVRLWRAVRVTAARGGAMRSEGLEAPFVGRERELRLVKELFHAAVEGSRAHLVQITGIAGIGKSRLTWEFFKYLDGLAENVWWHRGRCLAYGEGVTYWALAEMVRTRADIVEGEGQESAREKLAACLAEHVPDVDERTWVGPRLANLLGLEERADTDRQELFAAWRAFFERLADKSPVVLVFEDLQWGDQALLSFVEYLLEWSVPQRLYVLALSRPELAERRPDFCRGVRNSSSLALAPLSDEELSALLDGYVPGLPGELTDQVLARAQGVPLYAVETVRMLLDRGLLTRDGAVYRPTGRVESLEIPESLRALAAARLDGLTGEERALVHKACVLGKSFTKRAVASLSGRPEAELEPLLTTLVRKEVLALHADRRQPERGQYAFLQELLREIAYGTLSRRDRKLRHLAAVAALEETYQGADQEVPEVLAAHLLAAAEALPDDPDAAEIRSRALEALVQAGERAADLAAPDEAQRHLDRAAALATHDPLLHAELLVRAGSLAWQAGSSVEARTRIEQAIELHRHRGDGPAAARAGVALADVDHAEGRYGEAIRRLEAALPVLEQADAPRELAATLGQLGRMRMLRGELEPALATLERALALAETHGLEETLIDALVSKASALSYVGRQVEARLLLEGALARAKAGELHRTWWRAANNLGVLLEKSEQYRDELALSAEVAADARRRGNREQLAMARIGMMPSLIELGQWQEAVARVAEAERLQASQAAHSDSMFAASVLCEQGALGAADDLLRRWEVARSSQHAEHAAGFAALEARLLRAHRRPAEALAAAERGLTHRHEVGISSLKIKQCLVEALEAAMDLDDVAKAGELLGLIDTCHPGQLTPSLIAQRARFQARLDARRGSPEHVECNYSTAEETFARNGLLFHHAVTQLEHAEWLTSQRRTDGAAPLLAGARSTFEQLQAKPWLERLDAVQTARQTAEIPA